MLNTEYLEDIKYIRKLTQTYTNAVLSKDTSEDKYEKIMREFATKISKRLFKKKIDIRKDYKSEEELYFKCISLYDTVYDWNLSDTQIWILVYLIRYKYSKETRDIICKNLKISKSSLNTTLSYLRTGNVGGKKIKKILSIDSRNNNITLLDQKLLDIKTMIEEGFNRLDIHFTNDVSR